MNVDGKELRMSRQEQQLDDESATSGSPETGTGPAGMTQHGLGEEGRLTAEHAYYLQRTQVISELHEELEAWAKKRLWMVAIIVLVLGFFGTRALVRDMVSSELREAMKATAIAETAAEQAKKVSKEVRSEADNHKTLLEEMSARAGKVSTEIDVLRSKIKAEGLHAIAKAQLEVESMASRLEELESLVRDVASTSQSNTGKIRSYQKRLSLLDRSTTKTKAQFERNSDFVVMVV